MTVSPVADAGGGLDEHLDLLLVLLKAQDEHGVEPGEVFHPPHEGAVQVLE